MEEIKRIFRKFKKDEIGDFAAQSAFFTILSIIPFMIIFISLIQYINVDKTSEIIIKEYISGPTIFDMVCGGISVEPFLIQVREMAELAKNAGFSIDYFPTNFVVQDGLIYYVDYECNLYMDEWNFENWGMKYWSRTPEFEEYLKNHA